MHTILDELIEKWGEHIEMIPVEDQQNAIIKLLCDLVMSERLDKEWYKEKLEYVTRPK